MSDHEADDARRQEYACDICGNYPDECGMLEHGRGCYRVEADGGGYEFIPDAVRETTK